MRSRLMRHCAYVVVAVVEDRAVVDIDSLEGCSFVDTGRLAVLDGLVDSSSMDLVLADSRQMGGVGQEVMAQR